MEIRHRRHCLQALSDGTSDTRHAAATHRRQWAWVTRAVANDRYLRAALRFRACLYIQTQSQRTMGGVCAAHRRNMPNTAYKYECTARKSSVIPSTPEQDPPRADLRGFRAITRQQLIRRKHSYRQNRTIIIQST